MRHCCLRAWRDCSACADGEQQHRDQSALIRTENIIRSDMITELHELLELYCELLLARSGLLETTPCDPGLEEAVRSIIYAAPKTEIKELQMARALMIEKFGKEFGAEAMEARGVPPRITDRLKVEPPKPELVEGYLTVIAETYGVNWPRKKKDETTSDGKDEGEDGDGDDGGQKEKPLEAPLLAADELRGARPPKDVDTETPPVRIAPASPSTENPSPRVKIPGKQVPRPAAGAADGGDSVSGSKKDVSRVDGKIPDVDELARRFAALKR